MAILEDVKKLAEQATGLGRPRPRDLHNPRSRAETGHIPLHG